MFVAVADHSMLECTIPRAADPRIVDGGTQHHPLSAAVNNPMVCGARDGTFQHAHMGEKPQKQCAPSGPQQVPTRRFDTPCPALRLRSTSGIRDSRCCSLSVGLPPVIYSALVRSHQSTSLVASASCVPRGYNTRTPPCLKMWRGSPDLPAQRPRRLSRARSPRALRE